jgi:hypothetical protein
LLTRKQTDFWKRQRYTVTYWLCVLHVSSLYLVTSMEAIMP